LFLATARISSTLDRVIVAHIALFAFDAAVAPLLSYQLAAILTSLTGVSFSVLAVIAGIICLRRGQHGARYFLLAWTLLLVGVAVMGLRNLNWLPTTFLTTHAILIGSSLEMLLLSFALASRISKLQREKVRAQNNSLAASQHAERDLEQKVAERTQELAVANTRIQQALDAIGHVAATDSLTGMWNRRWLEKNAAVEISRARRYRQPLSLILLDIDQFKRVNDRLGHAAGDAVLIELAGVIRDQIRTSDSLTRWGGEEFVILAPSTTLEGAAHLAEKVRCAVGEHPFGGAGYVTVSMGVSDLADDERLDDFIAAADAALYRAKQGGRNRVEIARPPVERVAAALA
jgi:diguanylate cyclase (GGDEF)-like protein